MDFNNLKQTHLYELITSRSNGEIVFPKDKKLTEMTALDLFGLMGAYKNLFFPEFWVQIAQEFLGVKTECEISDAHIQTDIVSKLTIFEKLEPFLIRKGFTLDHLCHFEDSVIRRPIYDKMKVGRKTYKIIKNGMQFWKGKKHNLIVRYDGDFITLFAPEEHQEAIDKLGKSIEDYGLKHSVLRNKVIRMDGTIIKIEKKFTWEDVILPKTTKEKITGNVTDFFSNLEVYKKNKIALKRGLLLFGPPGTGKTLIGKILACQTKCTFIWVTCQDILNGDVRSLFQLARKLSPCIIFMEDMDFYSAKRNENFAKQTLGELLAQLDGFEENHGIIVIGTTNDIEAIDTAISDRPSRFDIQVEIGRPNQAARKKMLITKFKDIKTDNVDWDELSKLTDDYSGAHIQELKTATVLQAVKDMSVGADKKIRVKQKHIEEALEAIKVRRDKSGDAVGFEFDDDEKTPDSVEDVIA
jgi:SpoVK/Ycf46/Vps4 family AAA+-type ATPase